MEVTIPVQKLNGEIIKLERIQSTIRAYKNNKDIGKDLQTIKQIPITNYLTPNTANKILCIFHNEKTPSMQYYPETNHLYCFVCQKRGTVIDVIMNQMNLSFKDAVKFLSK